MTSSQIARALAKRRKGVIEVKSEAKAESCRNNLALAREALKRIRKTTDKKKIAAT